jgi:hypothetical protein
LGKDINIKYKFGKKNLEEVNNRLYKWKLALGRKIIN